MVISNHPKWSLVITQNGHFFTTVVVSFTGAKSIIILTSDHDMGGGQGVFTPDVADSKNLRVLLAVLSCRNQLSGHIVVELCDIDNMKHVKLIGGSKVEVVVSHDILGRAMIQCSRAPNMPQLYDAIFGFEGSEFYFQVLRLWGIVESFTL